jgi:hypothetical protein
MRMVLNRLAVIFIVSTPLVAHENRMPLTSEIMLKAFAAENLAVEYVAHIPIYGYFRKIACPVITQAQERVNYIKTFADLLFKRQHILHIQGTTGGVISINADNTVTWCDDEGTQHQFQELPCFNRPALNEFIKLAEYHKEVPIDGFSRNQEVQLTMLGLHKLFSGNKKLLSLYCFTPYDDMLYDVATESIDDIQIKKPLTQQQFEQLKDDLSQLYNYGVDVKDSTTQILPQPIDIALLHRIKKLVE